MSSVQISVILPTHNERDNVAVLIYMLDKVLKGISAEIVIVDDGSTDRTEEHCKEIAKHVDIPVQVLVRTQKTGLGNAYKKGVEYTTGKYIVIMDADLSHDPRDILRLYKKIEESNSSVVVGTRYAHGGGFCNWPLRRRVTSCGANIIAQIFTGQSVSDMTNSYRIYKTDKLKGSIRAVRAQGFTYQVEILHRMNAAVEEVPVKFYDRAYGISKLSASEYIGFVWWGARILAERICRRVMHAVYAKKE